MSGTRRSDTLLAAAAFVAGAFRATALPVPTDSSFHLVRVGQGLFRNGLDVLSVSPGGEGAPILGALATGAGALFAGGVQDLGRPAGVVLLGACAAILALALTRAAGRTAAVLGVALLVAPPALASSFPARPDAALGGALLAASFARILSGKSGLIPAWAACLSSPGALPAAILLQAGAGSRLRSASGWAGVALAVGLVTALSLAAPADSRAELLRGIFSDWALPGPGLRSTGGALLKVWGAGVLLVSPLLLLRFRGDPGRRLALPFTAAACAGALFSEPGAFRETTALLAAPACLLLALLVGRSAGTAQGPGPQRGLIAAFAVPAAFLLFGTAESAAWRRLVAAQTARDAQVADFLRDRLAGAFPALARRTGALAALSGRDVRVLGTGAVEDLPAVVVFSLAVRPGPAVERRLLAEPGFLARQAPLVFRRGPTNGIQDAVWVPRAQPVPLTELPADYASLLHAGWSRHAQGDAEGALRSFRAATALEPDGLGIAHEWAGMMFEKTGNHEAAEILLIAARSRDSTTSRARALLADRAITRGKLARADSLLAEAFAFTEHDPELWGLRARFMGQAGDTEGALTESETALRMNPRSGVLIANHGILLWMSGDTDAARAAWRLAVERDRKVLGYLGDFEDAPADMPAPPLLPLLSLQDFSPRGEN